MKPNQKEYPPIGLDDSLRFGKHKGKPLWEVMDDDPGWVRWAMENAGLLLDNEAFKELEGKK